METKECVLTREALLEELEAAQKPTEEEIRRWSDPDYIRKSCTITVLSAPPETRPDNTYLERTAENVARIKFAAQLVNTYEEVRPPRSGHLLDVSVCLNGEREQLPMMVEVALAEGISSMRIVLFDCGPRGVGNTRTQCAYFNHLDQDGLGSLVITTWYHVPRVRRTIDPFVRDDPGEYFPVIGIPEAMCDFPTADKVEGEIERIFRYVEKGDIAAWPR